MELGWPAVFQSPVSILSLNQEFNEVFSEGINSAAFFSIFVENPGEKNSLYPVTNQHFSPVQYCGNVEVDIEVNDEVNVVDNVEVNVVAVLKPML